MRHVSEFPRKVFEHTDWGIVMPDGCRLSARVWIPEDAEDNPVPVILEHLPYRKRDGTIARDEFTHPWFAGHGYCCIRTDMRGNGESEGLMDDEYTEQELQDACDVIAWAASQSWCNGNVGMMGISWGGFNGLQVAALDPPALKAVITICSTVDRYADDIHYKGGCLLNENFGWSANMASYSSRPPDPMLVGENKWKDIWISRMETQPWHLQEWLRHQHRDDYWKHGSICEDYSAIKAAVLSLGGWHDGYRNTISHLVENLNSQVKGIVGPWNHKYPHYAGPKPAIGFLQEARRWWDRWLKDEATGVEDDPDYRVYLMDSLPAKRWYDERPGRWIAEQDWPSPAIEAHLFHCQGDGTLGKNTDTFALTVASPQDCGRGSGEYFPFAFGDELPGEQSGDDSKSLCFDAALMTDDTDIVGAPVVRLRLAADKPMAQIAVRLCDVHPDGSSAHITYGVLNLTHHRSHETPQPLVPGEMIDVTVTLDQIAYRLPAGHRMRLAMSNAYWPMIWPSPEVTKLTVERGTLELPVRSRAEGDEWHFEEPEGAAGWRIEELRPTSYQRSTSLNPETGINLIEIDCDFGENRDLEHGLISGGWVKERWTIHPDDPNSARGHAEWEKTGGREGAMWRTHVVAEMSSTKTAFLSSATMKAYENGALIYEKSWEDEVPRNLV